VKEVDVGTVKEVVVGTAAFGCPSSEARLLARLMYHVSRGHIP